MKICHIYGAGEYNDAFPPPYDPERIRYEEEYIIAADGGYEYLMKRGITPNQIVGDFDSSAVPLEDDDGVVVLPKVKDITDTGAAVRMAIKLGFDKIHIYGGTGGRFDHTVANLQLLRQISVSPFNASIGYLFTHGGGEMHKAVQVITVVTAASVTLPSHYEGYLSVFAFGGYAEGVVISGMKYDLVGAILQPHDPVGVSNEFVGKPAFISVRSGSLLLIFDYKPAA